MDTPAVGCVANLPLSALRSWASCDDLTSLPTIGIRGGANADMNEGTGMNMKVDGDEGRDGGMRQGVGAMPLGGIVGNSLEVGVGVGVGGGGWGRTN